MSARSASEATRFTSTGPQASSKPSSGKPVAYSRPVGSTPYASIIDLTSPPPPNETPQQKVHRLREAALRMKAERESTFDKIVRRGRIWADRAHHTTVAGLVGISLVSMLIAGYSVGDMVLYNRRKRKEWYKEQQQNYDRALERAYKAEKEGNLTGDLALILNHARAIMEWEISQEAKKGRIKRGLEWVFGGLAIEEPPGGQLNLGKGELQILADGGRLMRVNEEGKAINDDGSSVDVNGQSTSSNIAHGKQGEVIAVINNTSLQASRRGGMLDSMADQTATSLKSASMSLWDRILGR